MNFKPMVLFSPTFIYDIIDDKINVEFYNHNDIYKIKLIVALSFFCTVTNRFIRRLVNKLMAY
jgi:hypothetical protein